MQWSPWGGLGFARAVCAATRRPGYRPFETVRRQGRSEFLYSLGRRRLFDFRMERHKEEPQRGIVVRLERRIAELHEQLAGRTHRLGACGRHLDVVGRPPGAELGAFVAETLGEGFESRVAQTLIV